MGCMVSQLIRSYTIRENCPSLSFYLKIPIRSIVGGGIMWPFQLYAEILSDLSLYPVTNVSLCAVTQI